MAGSDYFPPMCRCTGGYCTYCIALPQPRTFLSMVFYYTVMGEVWYGSMDTGTYSYLSVFPFSWRVGSKMNYHSFPSPPNSHP